ncbi:hypothetical protein [Amphibacillus cookii]|uniref:hypothetical protein n=1 Tax=Amphibacillus cookii TaxID=767787 RepID=UPI00195BD4CF|nr:hypothetical protein [Amphibacillus cookii]MBM7540705.1 hypothetical protein [Amphibacillus cookii]
MKLTSVLCLCMIGLFGCSEQDVQHVLLFTELDHISQEEVIEAWTNDRSLQTPVVDLNVEIIPPVYERLIMEIAAHNGDLLIIDTALLTPTILDPEGLVPLDEIVNQEQLTESFTAYHKVENTNHIYGIQLLTEDLIPSIKEPKEWVALIPIYVNDVNQSKQLLVSWLE